MENIVIFGAGGFGREVANIIEKINTIDPQYNILGFIVEEKYYKDSIIINGYPVLGTEKWIIGKENVKCICAIADCMVRNRIQTQLSEKKVEFATIIAPGVRIPPSTIVGDGCVIYSNCLISVNVKIGNGVLINSGTTIGHDVIIDNFVSIAPGCGISGNCLIETGANIGGHAFVIPKRKIGKCAVVAAGSIVFNNVKAGTTVLGNPAKRFRILE